MNSRINLIFTALRRRPDPAAVLVKLALRKALLDCESVLDVGCGPSITLRELGAPQTTGIDGYQKDLDEAKRRNTHDQLVLGDVRALTNYFKPKQFDACISMDVIEHLEKEDGIKLMRNMESLARKKVILFTPCGFLPQRHRSNDDLQEHLSGWEPAEMEAHGYKVMGQLGPKSLRGEGHVLKRRPRFFWSLISCVGQVVSTHNHPKKAAAIFCVKEFGK